LKSIPIEHPIPVDGPSRKLLKRLWDKGYVSWVVGGAVRDHLLGLAPKDLDWVTDCPTDVLESVFPEALPVGRNFGVFLIPKEGGGVLELATFRKDGPYLDHRHPVSVAIGTAEEDALRRDFSINAIYYDPKTQRIIDYVGGIEDLLHHKVLRAIGSPEARFQEDALRILRAIRFSAKLNLRIEERTMRDLTHSLKLLKKLSGERIREELLKALGSKQGALACRKYFELGIVAHLFGPDLTSPEVAFTDAEVWLESADEVQIFSLFFSSLARKGGLSAIQSVSDRMKLSRSVAQKLSQWVMSLPKLVEVFEMRTSNLIRWVREDDFERFLPVAKSFLHQASGDVMPVQFLSAVLTQEKSQASKPRIDFKGEDLVSLGFQPGPLFKDILTVIEDQILEGKICTKDEAYDFVMRTFGDS